MAKRKIPLTINPDNMSKGQAEAAMIAGKKVAHELYDEDSNEHIFLNEDKIIEGNDGVKHGSFEDKFWSQQQKWSWGWRIVD